MIAHGARGAALVTRLDGFGDALMGVEFLARLNVGLEAGHQVVESRDLVDQVGHDLGSSHVPTQLGYPDVKVGRARKGEVHIQTRRSQRLDGPVKSLVPAPPRPPGRFGRESWFQHLPEVKHFTDIVEPKGADEVPLAREDDDPAILDEEAQGLADRGLGEPETDGELGLENGLPGLEPGMQDLFTKTAMNSFSEERPAVSAPLIRPGDICVIHAGEGTPTALTPGPPGRTIASAP